MCRAYENEVLIRKYQLWGPTYLRKRGILTDAQFAETIEDPQKPYSHLVVQSICLGKSIARFRATPVVKLVTESQEQSQG